GDRRKRGREPRIGTCAVYDLSPDHGQERLDFLDPVLGNLEIVGGKDREVGKLPGLQRAFPSLLARDPGAARRIQAQRLAAIEKVPLALQLRAAQRLAGDEPVQTDP